MADKILVEDDLGNTITVSRKAFEAGAYPGFEPADVLDSSPRPRGSLIESPSGYIGDSPSSGQSAPAHNPTKPEDAPKAPAPPAMVTREDAAALTSEPTPPAEVAGGDVGAEASIDVSTASVQAVIDHVRDHPDERDALLEAERAGKNRSTLITALEKPKG